MSDRTILPEDTIIVNRPKAHGGEIVHISINGDSTFMHESSARRVYDMLGRILNGAEQPFVSLTDLHQALADYEDGKSSNTQFRDAVRFHQCRTEQA